MRAQRLCVFCGSSPGVRPAYADAAAELGRTLATRGIGLVYGGGSVGLMGTVADAALEAGGEVLGVIPRGLFPREVAHNGLTELRVTNGMHERKATMIALADAFVALPGGNGTFEELFEVVTWRQIGIHDKPCGVLDVDGFYAPLVAFLDGVVREGFVRQAERDRLVVASGIDELLAGVLG